MGGQHPRGDDLAHTGQLHHGVALQQIQAGLGSGGLGSGSGRGGGSSRGRGSVLLGFGGGQDVLQDDTAGGAGAGDAGIVNTHLGRGLAGQGGDADTGAVRGGHGSGSCGRGGSGSSLHSGCCGSGSGGVAARNRLAGLADVGKQALDGDILALLGHDLQHHAVVLAGDLVGQLIGGDLHDHVADLHLVAFVLDPGGDSTLLHGQAQLRHQYFKSHLLLPPHLFSTRLTALTMSSGWGKFSSSSTGLKGETMFRPQTRSTGASSSSNSSSAI